MKRVLFAALTIAMSTFAAAQSTSAKPATKPQEKTTVKKSTAAKSNKSVTLKQETAANARTDLSLRPLLPLANFTADTTAIPAVKKDQKP
jgi:hypothetical protein